MNRKFNMEPPVLDIQLFTQLALRKCNSISSIRQRTPSFGRIQTKSIRSTRTLDSTFMADYHNELDTLRRKWESRVFQFWGTYWDKSPIPESLGQEYLATNRQDSSHVQLQSPEPAQTSKDYPPRFSIFGRDLRQWHMYLELKRHQAKAVILKRKIDHKYRHELGLRKCKTSAEDFPVDINDLACFWEPWYVTEYQPSPYMRQKAGTNYTIREYYSSDHRLRLRKVHLDG